MIAEASQRTEPARASRVGTGLGLLPLFAFTASLGLLIVALADDGARSGKGFADPVFWLGVTVIVAPLAGRQFAASTGRRERIGLVISLAVAAYLIKVMHSPLQFTLHDEFGHLRSTQDILLGGHLFTKNPLVATYGSYPGLEALTAVVSQLTGLSVFSAGMIVVGAARLVLAVGLFLLLEQVSGSGRIAGLGTALYAANPNFVFFGSIYAYESLAIPLGIMAVAMALRAGAGRRNWPGAALAALIISLAVVPTHHVTSWALAVTFGLLCAFAFAGRRDKLWLSSVPGAAARYLPLFLITAAAVAAWIVFVGGTDTDNSLGPVATSTYHSVSDLITGSAGAKKPFQTSGVTAETPLEQAVGIASVLMILASAPVGLVVLRRRGRLSPMEGILALCVLAYPFSLAIRLTSAGTETSNRASEFLFMGIAYVIALAMTAKRKHPLGSSNQRGLVKGGAVVAAGAYLAFLIIGGIIVGWPPYARLPGTYEPAAGPRSVDPYVVAAADWAGANVPRKTAVATDSLTGSLVVAKGLDPQRGKANGTSVPRLFFTRRIGPVERGIIRFDHIRYVIVDRRLSTARPQQGQYFEGGDPAGVKLGAGIPLQALTKFDGARGFSKVYDSGPIQIYDTSRVVGGTRR